VAAGLAIATAAISPREIRAQAGVKPGATRAAFGTMPNGTRIEVFTLTNASGMEVRAINYGAIIASIKVPDRTGKLGDVVLGYDTLDGYVKDTRFFGAVVGRYGNRIAKGKFTLDGREYTLAINNPPNHLHGGPNGFNKQVWTASIVATGANGPSVTFTRTSPDGEEGYPGTLQARVTYTLTERNELDIQYEATTDKPTPVNLTQHSYFNLMGAGNGPITDHGLRINADRYTPVDSTLIPTGKIAEVAGTPLDFRSPKFIGARIDANDEQIKIGGGYDHNFVLNRQGTGLAHAVWLNDERSGRSLDVFTTEPGIQFYTGNHLDGVAGKGGATYGRRSGLCLETQHFPDSPNKPDFPSTIVKPGTPYTSRTVWRFSVVK
jgi:aldose 1-epimerase